MDATNPIWNALKKADSRIEQSPIKAIYDDQPPLSHEDLQKCIRKYDLSDTVTITREQFLEAFSAYYNPDIQMDKGSNPEWEKIVKDEFSRTVGNWIFDGMRTIAQP